MDTHRNIMYVEDRIYPTDNLWEIPCLLLSPQPSAGYLANCTAWGHTNVRREVQLWHFYEDDKKFETLYKHPEKILNAFATRGYAERPQALEYEIDIARNVSGKQTPNMLVFGGGKEIEHICHRAKICYIPLSVYKKGGPDE